MATTLGYLTKKMSNPALSLKKTSTMPKNFRNRPIIKVSSLEAMFLVIKFGWITNILRQNKIGN